MPIGPLIMMKIWAEAGYDTPRRIAAALKPYVQLNDRILDFGCGTGLSGLALQMPIYKY